MKLSQLKNQIDYQVTEYQINCTKATSVDSKIACSKAAVELQKISEQLDEITKNILKVAEDGILPNGYHITISVSQWLKEI